MSSPVPAKTNIIYLQKIQHKLEEIINEVYSNNYSQLYEFEKLLKNPYEKIKNKKYITPPLESEKVFETFCGT